MNSSLDAEVIIVGGGLAGVSAGIYLGRAQRQTLIIDSAKSMARWEPDVQNYLGFPEGIAGSELLKRGAAQARRYGVSFKEDEINSASLDKEKFILKGRKAVYCSRRLLLATGIFHIPPDLDGVKECLGHSIFFCKDCDGYRVQGKTIAIYGSSNEASTYALAMLLYSRAAFILTDGKAPRWDERHAGWLKEYEIPVYRQPIIATRRQGHQIQAVIFPDQTEVSIEALFTTRGDVYFNHLAKDLSAKVDDEGQILVDENCATTVPGLYAAGCVTPANCQMIIAAGQGAVAAQAINRDLIEQSLRTHSLRIFPDRELIPEPSGRT